MQKYLNYLLVFLIALLVVQMFTKAPQQAAPTGDVVITAPAELTVGKPALVQIKNNTAAAVQLKPVACPALPFPISRYENGIWQLVTATAPAAACTPLPATLATAQTLTIDLSPWQRTLFVATGKYKIELPVTVGGTAKTFLHEMEVTPRGWFTTAWNEAFYRPIYNLLIWFTDFAGGSFGWGVVLLTLALRIVLFYPFQKSLAAQRRMQKIQPELDKIRTQYKDNQQMLALETMALFKKHQVNPLGSCLPMLLQTPFFIAIFWIVQSGLSESNHALLYAPLTQIDFAQFATQFAGLDLLAHPGADLKNYGMLALPFIVAGLQFAQMRLAMAHARKKQATQPTKKPDNIAAEATQKMGEMMQYFLPGMIAVFSFSMPAAVGLYWAVSTLFGVGQQVFVNKLVK